MESYIVRILRRSIEDPEEIVGFVEKPEIEEKLTFQNIGELISIFIAPDLTSSPDKRKQVLEQRKYRRFPMQEGTVIFNSITDIGVINDISMGGLSFICSNIIDDCPETTEISILCGDEKNNLRNLKCKKINRHNFSDNSAHSHPEKLRRFSLAFDNPTPQQKALLENIIQDCTILEV